MELTAEQQREAMLIYSQLIAQKNAGTTGALVNGHGPGGVFARLGVNQQIFNAALMPQAGLARKLKVQPTNIINPLQMIYTGMSADTGTDPAGFCDPGKIAGNMKTGVIGNSFGRYVRSTATINISDTTLGGQRNRGELFDFNLVGGLVNEDMKAITPITPRTGNPLTSEYSKVMTEYLIGWYNAFGRNLYQGNPASNTGGMKYFRGLDILINTGYTDAETGAALTNANSKIVTNAADLDNTILPKIIGLYRYQKDRAAKLGLDVQFEFVMTTMMFYELTAIWPTAYYTSRAAVAAGVTATMFLDTRATISDRDDLRAGQYLLIDGTRVPVTIDDSIKETALTAGDIGKYSSTIYLLPMSVNGQPGLVIEYFDYNNTNTEEFLRALGGSNDKYVVTNNGRFLWVRRENGFCVSFDAVNNDRVRLDFPFLAGRITGTKVLPSQLMDSGYSDDGARYVTSGAATSPAGTYTVTP